MEKSNLSNVKEDIQSLNSNIFLHFIQPSFIPVGTQYVSILNINDLPDDHFTQIFISDALDYVSYNEATSVLDNIVKKLKKGGELVIQSVDLYHLANAITFYDIDIETSKIILYRSNKEYIYTIHEIKSELNNRNLDITEQKYINIFEYYIVSRKK